MAQDPTLPRLTDANRECPNPECSNIEYVYFQSHSTKAEQGMQLYYVCTSCGEK